MSRPFATAALYINGREKKLALAVGEAGLRLVDELLVIVREGRVHVQEGGVPIFRRRVAVALHVRVGGGPVAVEAVGVRLQRDRLAEILDGERIITEREVTQAEGVVRRRAAWSVLDRQKIVVQRLREVALEVV